jgi:hypothetical protein
MHHSYKTQQENKILSIQLGVAYLELAGKFSDEIYEIAEKLEKLEKRSPQQDRIIGAQFSLITEICTNSPESMSDDQLRVAMQYVLDHAV